jgi:pyruvate dehydrogenase E2 component (dihydrolipoamide acetyltransferase)
VAKIIDLPKLSPTMEEGTLVRWAKSEGDKIDVDDLLAEVETDKATMEFRAFDRGTLLKRLIPEGATAKLGQPVAIFGEPGEDVSALLAQVGGGAPSAAPAKPSEPAKPEAAPAKPSEEKKPEAAPAPQAAAPAPAPATPAPVARETPRGPAPSALAPTAGIAGIVLLPPARPNGAVAAGEPGGPSSPRVRRLARERGISLELVRGSGDHGRITTADLERAPVAPARGAPAAAAARPTAEDTVRPASQMRKAIARRLTEAKRDVPHFSRVADLDVEALGELREQLNDGLEKDQRISVTDLLVRACALALREVPMSNASWIDGNIVVHNRVDISLAVAIDDGLVTPVLRDVDLKSVRTIAQEAKELAARARARKLKPEEMQGGVFSLSNLGMYGIDRFSAVINPPEGMILAVGATRDVPVVKAGQIVPGKRCAMTLSCDHRVVDGALGAQYLKALRGLIEKPVKILA